MASNDGTSVYESQSRVPMIVGSTIGLTVFSSIFVLARFYSRAVITRVLGMDDLFIMISWVASIVLSILHCLAVYVGVGRHTGYQQHPDLAAATADFYSSRLVYQLVLGTTKISLCCMYIRIFRDRISAIYMYCVLALTCAFTLGIEIFVAVRCKPVNITGVLGCPASSPDMYVSSLCNILVDIALLGFVVPRIGNLKINSKQKKALYTVVCLGILGTVAAIVRLIEILHLRTSKDVLWDYASISTWSCVEVHCGIFCACAPAIRPLMRQVTTGFHSMRGSHNTTNDAYVETSGRSGGTIQKSSQYGSSTAGSEWIQLSRPDSRATEPSQLEKMESDHHERKEEEDGAPHVYNVHGREREGADNC